MAQKVKLKIVKIGYQVGYYTRLGVLSGDHPQFRVGIVTSIVDGRRVKVDETYTRYAKNLYRPW